MGVQPGLLSSGEAEAEAGICGQGYAVGEGKREKPGPLEKSANYGDGVKDHSPTLGCGEDAGANLICQAAPGTLLW